MYVFLLENTCYPVPIVPVFETQDFYSNSCLILSASAEYSK